MVNLESKSCITIHSECDAQIIASQASVSERSSIEQARRTLLLLDAVSSEVCSVIDAAELCLQVHEDEEHRAQAAHATQVLSGLIHALNADIELYNALVAAMEVDSSSSSSTSRAAVGAGRQRRLTSIVSDFLRIPF
jgi:Zn-dependent oligopeptidase